MKLNVQVLEEWLDVRIGESTSSFFRGKNSGHIDLSLG